jgi:hypothetical protein
MEPMERTQNPPQTPPPKPDVDDLIFSWQCAKEESDR